jgi:hypothetical protein
VRANRGIYGTAVRVRLALALDLAGAHRIPLDLVPLRDGAAAGDRPDVCGAEPVERGGHACDPLRADCRAVPQPVACKPSPGLIEKVTGPTISGMAAHDGFRGSSQPP